MKKGFLAGITVLILLLCAVMAFAACDTKVGSISIERNNMPQTTFVLGNELDLSKGKLTADGKSVPLTDSGVSVSGYDKNKEGEQTLTISYGGQTTTLVVNVVPRFRPADDYVYFLGETYADAQPRLNITRDDGTRITVNANDSGLKITGLDTSKTAEKLTLTAVYDKNDEHFEGSFDVSVADPVITFRKPSKLAYGSHERTLSMTGASLTLKNADGSATRNVASSELVLEGYDPKAVTAANKTATQTITVKYRGREMTTFDVTVEYSDVSLFIDTVANFPDEEDWDCYRQPEDGSGMAYPDGVTEETFASAVEMLQLYLGLSRTDAAFISQDQLDAAARLAVVYGYNTWTKTMRTAYADTFTVSEVGEISYTATSTPALAESTAQRLNAKEDEVTKLVYQISELMNNETLLDKCDSSYLYNSVVDGVQVTMTIKDLATYVYTPLQLNHIADLLELAVEAHESVAAIQTPADGWLNADLSAHKATLDAVYDDCLVPIYESDVTDASVFPLINGWREKEDFFEIFYRCYMPDALDDDSATAESSLVHIANLSTMMLPVPLEELRTTYNSAYTVQLLMQTYAGMYDPESGDIPMILESTLFLYQFRQAEKETNEFLQAYQNDAVYYALYSSFLLESLNTLYSGEYGYYELAGNTGYDTELEALWDIYFDLYNQYSNDAVTDPDAFDQNVAKMFGQFVDLEPIQQYYFLTTLNYLYPDVMSVPVLSPYYGYLLSDFASFIYDYYCTKLGIDLDSAEESTAYDLFSGLLVALEAYANDDVETFCTYMQDMIELYNGKWETSDQKAAFDEFLKPFYDKYVGYFELYEYTQELDSEGKPAVDEDGQPVMSWTYHDEALGDTMGGYEQTFKEMEIATANTSLASTFIDMGMDLYLPFLASYEQIVALEAEILGSNNESVINAYYHMKYGSTSYPEPLFNTAYEAKNSYLYYLEALGIDRAQYEEQTALRAFIREYANYFWTSASLQLDGSSGMMLVFSGEKFEFNDANVKALINAFLSLTAEEQYAIITLDTSNLYFGGLEAGMASIFDKKTAETQGELLSQLLNTQIMYIAYSVEPDGSYEEEDGTEVTYKEALFELWETFETAYTETTAESKTEFDQFFKDLYDHMADAVSALSETQQAA